MCFKTVQAWTCQNKGKQIEAKSKAVRVESHLEAVFGPTKRGGDKTDVLLNFRREQMREIQSFIGDTVDQRPSPGEVTLL